MSILFLLHALLCIYIMLTRVEWGLRYAYFPSTTASLLDKLTRASTNTIELGGAAASVVLDASGTVAIHTTCYEHVTKVLGLKAANAFWNPRYYDPSTPTITKQIIFIDEKQLLEEMRSLIWLATVTGSTLIIPNILGSTDGSKFQNKNAMDLYENQILWPAYRVIHLRRENGQTIIKTKIAEPGFYWRIERDYGKPPDPTVIFFDPKNNLDKIQVQIENARKNKNGSRIVLHSSIAYPNSKNRKLVLSQQQQISKTKVSVRCNTFNQDNQESIERVTTWAKHSVGLYADNYVNELLR